MFKCVSSNNGMANNLEIIVGTYEQFLLGYKVEQVSFFHMHSDQFIHL